MPGQQAWSPDGQRFAFIGGGNQNSRRTLAISGAEGGVPTALGVTVGVPFEVAWGPR